MADRSQNRGGWRLCLLCVGGLLVLAGCGPKNYKEDADQRVYDLIDRKWDPEFGTKANYRISDVTPGPNDIQMENAVPASGVLTLPYALSLATAHSRKYQTEKDRLYRAALDLRLVEHQFETQLFGGGSFLYGNNYQNSLKRPLGDQAVDEAQAGHTGLSAKHPNSEIVQTEGNIGFNRLLPTGAQLSTTVATAWADILAGRGDRGLNSVFSAVITQPLLRGSDPMIVLDKLTQAERDMLYQIRTFNRFRKTFAVGVATEYFRVLESYDVIRSAQAYHDGRAALHGRVMKLAEVGLVPRPEIDQVQQDVLRARDDVIVARHRYEQALDRLKLTLGLPMTAQFQIDVGLLDALQEHGLPRPELALDDAVETALSRRLDMANHADAVLDAQRAIYVAADKLRTDLRLKAEVRADTRGNRGIWVGPVLDLPLDRVPQQHEYRKALIALEERRRDYDDSADTVRLEVRNAHNKLLETAERYQVASEGLATAQKRLKTASVLLQYGQASSRRVLDAQHDLYDTRNVATSMLIEYAIATLDLYRDTEALQVRPDGMWEGPPKQGPGLPVTAIKTTAKASRAAK
ncbi:MAG: TolC family protein [Phycisphaerae bacterium]|nr:TolC family protein [Phycisphaerae bacterium]